MTSWLKKEQELRNKVAKIEKEKRKVAKRYQENLCPPNCRLCGEIGDSRTCTFLEGIDLEYTADMDKLDDKKKNVEALLHKHYDQKPTSEPWGQLS